MKNLILFLLCSVSAVFAQGVRYGLPPILNPDGRPIPNVNVFLCTGTATITGTACSVQAQSFTDITLGTECSAGFPVTPTNNTAGAAGCSATSDATGNAGFWLAPGSYIYCVSGPNITGACYKLNAAVGVTSGGNTNLANLNGDPMSTTANGTILAFGDSACFNNFNQANTVTDNMVVCKDFSAGNLNLGVTSLWGNISVSGTVNQPAALDGLAGKTTTYGTLTTSPANMAASANGVEAEVAIASTGGQISYGEALLGGTSTFNNSTTNANYFTAIRGNVGGQSGTGVITGNFSGIFERQVFGTVNTYGIWNKASTLIPNGSTIDWMTAPVSVSTASMSGCPSTCLVSVTTSAVHGLATGNTVWINGIGMGTPQFQYEGFYVVTVTDGTHFTYTPIPQTANASSVSTGTVAKVLTSTIGVDGANRLVIKSLVDNATNGNIQFTRTDGNIYMAMANRFVQIDPLNNGFGLKLSTAGGFQFGAGTSMTGTTGSGSNVVTDNSPTIKNEIVAGGTVPTLSGTGACATIRTQVGGSWSGTFKCTGTTGASTVTISPGPTAANGWSCSASDETAGTNMAQSGHNTTSCTVKGSVTQNDVIVFTANAF
jgi:hypothetical protein